MTKEIITEDEIIAVIEKILNLIGKEFGGKSSSKRQISRLFSTLFLEGLDCFADFEKDEILYIIKTLNQVVNGR